MKKRFLSLISPTLAFICAVFVLGIDGSLGAEKPLGSTLPEAEKQKWQSIQKMLQRDWGVCREHCGNDKGCLEKCEKRYKSRLDKERQKLLYESGARSGKEKITKHASCPYCGMNRAKFAHSRVFIEYDDGSTLGACSLHCAAIDMAVNIDTAPKVLQVGDYNTKKLIDAESAFWVIGGNKMGVMTRRAKWAFESKESAEQFAGEYGGALSNFEDAMKASYEDMYKDTKMIREKRKMKRTRQKGVGIGTTEEKWGVTPISIRLTGGDHFVDFRYKVMDPDKAAALLSRNNKPFLIDQATDKMFSVPVTKLGPLRATAVKPKADRQYVILFGNANKMIKRGMKVTVVIGEFRAENLVVE